MPHGHEYDQATINVKEMVKHREQIKTVPIIFTTITASHGLQSLLCLGEIKALTYHIARALAILKRSKSFGIEQARACTCSKKACLGLFNYISFPPKTPSQPYVFRQARSHRLTPPVSSLPIRFSNGAANDDLTLA